MRYARAVERLRLLADACQATTRMSLDDPFLHEAYVFGEILEGADPIECLTVALTLNLSPDEVPWCSQPRGTAWLVHDLRLDKGGIAYWWRSRHEPIDNHLIRNPVRFWSLDGIDEAALRALQDHRFNDLHRVTTTPAEVEQHSSIEFNRALNQLRTIRQEYWDRDWRREHRGNGRYPENHLWEALDGYLELLDAENRSGEQNEGNPPA